MNASRTVYLGCCSGPRNISTAMMRSWGSRPDTAVIDEPFYAHYLMVTERDHPGREEILAHHDANWDNVVRAITGPIPDDKSIYFQKHMAHHLPQDLPANVDASDARLSFLDRLTHVLLIRDPREVLVSLSKVLAHITVEETGLPQQLWLWRRLTGRGESVPIVDARDVLENPPHMLEKLCGAVGVPFDPAMLHWQPGPRPTDGVWAKHWYANVENSTGFVPYRLRNEQVPYHLLPVLDQCNEIYATLHKHRLQ